MEEQDDIEMSMKFLYISPTNKNPLNIHEIPNCNFQTPTRMGVFHPQNWLKQEN